LHSISYILVVDRIYRIVWIFCFRLPATALAMRARRGGRAASSGESGAETKLDIVVVLKIMFRHINAAVVTTVVGGGFETHPYSESQVSNTERFPGNDSNSPQAIAFHRFHPGSDEKTCKILIILSSLKIKNESIPLNK